MAAYLRLFAINLFLMLMHGVHSAEQFSEFVNSIVPVAINCYAIR